MFNALGDGGKVTMPQSKTFFSARFGMLADKFGVGWMILVAQRRRLSAVNSGGPSWLPG